MCVYQRALPVLTLEILEQSCEFTTLHEIQLAVWYSSRRGAPGGAKNATACITSLRFEGKNSIGRF